MALHLHQLRKQYVSPDGAANWPAFMTWRQVREMVIGAAVDFDEFYASRQHRAEEQEACDDKPLVLTTDAKGVVMRPEDLREATRREAAARTHKLTKRLCKGEKRQAKRMAQVASIYDIERHRRTPDEVLRELRPVDATKSKRPRPERKRVWASVAQESEQVIDTLFAEGQKRDPQRRRDWVVLVDGNPHQLELIRANMRRRRTPATIILDIIHAVEYLWRAAHAFFGDGTREGEEWARKRYGELLKGKASLVAAGIRRSATRRRLTGAAREAADKTADYLLKYSHLMRYDVYLAAGYPIATGVIEGACRYLVKDRMDLTGARWGLEGAEAVLRLRALRASGDFDDYWRFHQRREHERNHTDLYADAVVPELLAPRRGRSHLRLVK